MPQQTSRYPSKQTLTIANGATASDAFKGAAFTEYGLVMPAAFTGASISFTVCDTHGGTYQALYDITNAAVAVTVAAGRSYHLPGELTAWPFWKIVSASAEGAERSLLVVAKG